MCFLAFLSNMNSNSLRTCTRFNCVCDPPYSVTGVCNIYAPTPTSTVSLVASTTTTTVAPVDDGYPISRTCTRYNCVCDPPYSATGVCNIYAPAVKTSTTSVVTVDNEYAVSRTCTRYNCACNPPFSVTGYCELYSPWRPNVPLTNEVKSTNAQT